MKGSFTLAGLFALLTLARAQNETLFSDGVMQLNKRDTDPWLPITVGLAAERVTSKDSVFHRFSSILGKGSRAGLPRDIPGQRFNLALPIDPSSKRISLPADLSAVSSPLDSAPTSSLLRRLYKRGPARSHRRKAQRHRKPQRNGKPQRHGKERKARKHRKSRQHRKTKSRTTAGEWTEVFAKASKLAVKETMTSTITWYTGHDLLYPSCVQNSKWSPKDSALVAAVTLDWDNKPPCGSFIRLRAAGAASDKAIVVRVVDACAGCKPGSAHFDLTKTGFLKLFDLDVGRVADIQAQVLASAPFDKWTPAMTALYGPEKL